MTTFPGRDTAAASPSGHDGPLQRADLRGLARLGCDGVIAVTDLVESVHRTITSGMLGRPQPGRTRGLTGAIYRSVRGSTRVVGTGLDLVLGHAIRPPPTDVRAARREAFVAALNGVIGDHLAATGNPLAIGATLRFRGRALDLEHGPIDLGPGRAAHRRVLVLVHGLCMNDVQWERRGHDHGRTLARRGGWTPLYLHYNSGRHVSENGRDLDALLERLVERWPVPLEELAIVGHSMGGLVARSACHHARGARHRWLGKLKKLAFLGTPHHGAALERGGHAIDRLLAISPYAAPFARIGMARSAGITDLRFGNVRDDDWQGRNRHSQRQDDRRPTPLPHGVDTLVVAATTRRVRGRLHDALVGDGVVPVASALGLHARPEHSLAVSRARVVAPADHWDLLDHPAVRAELREWLARAPVTARRGARSAAR